MTPVVLDALQQFLVVAVPAVLTFFAGHYHLVLPNPLANTATPATPAPPATPASPSNSAPLGLGHGGLLQLLGEVFQSILSHPTATSEQKTSAVSSIVNATAPLVK